ncbi:MAG: single-stranded DNA-binding protein [Pyrinomonadaceae bacterium]
MSANISLMGNLGRTPETRISDNGTLIATFPMASNSVRNTAEGQIKKTNWFRVTAFGKQAETLARYLRKGSRLCVQGRLTFSPWLNRNGEPQVSADVVLQEFQFVPGGRRDENGETVESAAIPPTEVQDVSGQSTAAN